MSDFDKRDLVRARESKRFEAACAAMQGILADCGGVAQHRMFMDTVPTTAVEYADLLLAALSESKEPQ